MGGISMTIPPGYIRVNARRKCPVCGRADWCLIHRDGGTALCPRTLSDRSWGECGFLHVVDAGVVGGRKEAAVVKQPPPKRIDDWTPRLAQYDKNITRDQIERLAVSLRVRSTSLAGLRIGFSHQHDAFTFPMCDHQGKTIGVRLRSADGTRKLSIVGGRNGLFIPTYPQSMIDGEQEWWVVEGPTDTAAMLDWQLPTIGRPSCSAGVDMTCRFLKGKSVVIVANYDSPKTRPDGSIFYPGQEGAAVLANALATTTDSVRVIYPRRGFKDVREWKRNGATLEELLSIRDNAVPWEAPRLA